VTTTLFFGGVVRPRAGEEQADWLLVAGDRCVAHGRERDRPAADRRVDLEGGALVPAFCDAHVHLPVTGLYARGLDFRGERSARAILEAFAARARNDDGILFGGNFEDPLDEPLDRTRLDDAVGDRVALLGRADMHSCIVSSALLKELDVRELEGVDVDQAGGATGYLRERAAAEAWRWFDANLPAAEQTRAVEAAAQQTYSKGVAAVHEMYVVEWHGWGSVDVFRSAAEGLALDVTLYLATEDVARVSHMGLAQIGGDYFLDGAFGSHTAWMAEPYESPPPAGTPANGISYRNDTDLVELFHEAQRAGLQMGVHAIGDAAIEQAIRGWEKVAEESGLEPVCELGHRIEHFECASDEHMKRAARLGLKASVQPAFDRYWGGEQGLYAERIGVTRALQMNRFGAMTATPGLGLGAGSDSTVTPLDPFLQMASLRAHHVREQSVTPAQALWLNTAGARSLAPSARPGTGLLEPEAAADLAWLDRDPVTAGVDDLPATEVLGTWIGGRRVWPPAAAEAT
jgi:predicted amidohydrolase YtcJ